MNTVELIALVTAIIAIIAAGIALHQASSARTSAINSGISSGAAVTSAEAAKAQAGLMQGQLNVMKRQLEMQEEERLNAQRLEVVPLAKQVLHDSYGRVAGYLTLKNQGRQTIQIINVINNGRGDPRSFLDLGFIGVPEPLEYLEPAQEGTIALGVTELLGGVAFSGKKLPSGEPSHVVVVFQGHGSAVQHEVVIDVSVGSDGCITIQNWDVQPLG